MENRCRFSVTLLLQLVLISGLLSVLVGPATAQSKSDALVEFSVYSDTQQINPGETFTLLFHARMQPDWHIYWKNSGETGMPTKISVDAPDGFEVGSIRWPRPITFKTGGLTTYGYGKETVLFVPVTAPESLPEPPYTFKAHITSLACKEKCVMQEQDVRLRIPDDHQMNKALRETVQRHRAAIPESFSSLKDSKVYWEDGSVVVEGPRKGVENLTFFPVSVSGVELGSPSVKLETSRFTMRIPVTWHPDNHLGEQKPAVKGVIALGQDSSGPSYQVSVPLKSGKN